MLGFWTSASGAENWTDLLDTPSTITASRPVVGNSGGTALEFGSNAIGDYLRRDGSNTIIGNIEPDTNGTRRLGSFTSPFRRIDSLNLVSGYTPASGATLTIDETYVTIGGVIGVGSMYGAGTNTVTVGGGYYSPAGTFGNTLANAGDTAELLNFGGGSFLTGSAFVGAGATNGTARLALGRYSYGSFLGGYAFQAGGTGTALLNNSGSGSFVWGYVAHNGNATSTVQSTGNAPGSFVAGRCQDQGAHTLQTGGAGAFAAGLCLNNGSHTIQSTNQGSFAQGRCGGNTSGGVIESTNQGSFAQGRTQNLAQITSTARGSFAQGNAQNSGAYIQASGNGSFAQGHVNGAFSIRATGFGAFAQGASTGGSILASANGAFAHGDADVGTITASYAGAFAAGSAGTYNITASAVGAFAFGSATTANIVASATNSVQIGPGTNAVADSLQIGTGVQFGTSTGNIRFDGRIDSNTTLVTTTTHNAGNEFVILCDDDTAGGAITVTLPLAATAQTMYNVKKLGTTGNVIVDGNGAETVDGAANTTITAQYSSRTLVSDGTSWHILTSQGA
ncbi:MAG: hypothetical protein ACR2OV_15900 [Hyphomicrobiaceae bacterium]